MVTDGPPEIEAFQLNFVRPPKLETSIQFGIAKFDIWWHVIGSQNSVHDGVSRHLVTSS